MSDETSIENHLEDISVECMKHIVVVREGVVDPVIYTRMMDMGYFQTTWGKEPIKMRDGVWMSSRSTIGYVAFVICLRD